MALGGVVGYRRYWKRIRNSNDVTGKMLDQQRWIKGVVTSVGDGGKLRTVFGSLESIVLLLRMDADALDNFRLFHTPGPFFSLPFKIRSIPSTTKGETDLLRHVHIEDEADTRIELKDQTLHIRISGIDAPENAHFGNPAQPHAKESWDWLKNTISGRRMKVQILRKDQYNRIVCRTGSTAQVLGS